MVSRLVRAEKEVLLVYLTLGLVLVSLEGLTRGLRTGRTVCADMSRFSLTLSRIALRDGYSGTSKQRVVRASGICSSCLMEVSFLNPSMTASLAGTVQTFEVTVSGHKSIEDVPSRGYVTRTNVAKVVPGIHFLSHSCLSIQCVCSLQDVLCKWLQFGALLVVFNLIM